MALEAVAVFASPSSFDTLLASLAGAVDHSDCRLDTVLLLRRTRVLQGFPTDDPCDPRKPNAHRGKQDNPFLFLKTKTGHHCVNRDAQSVDKLNAALGSHIPIEGRVLVGTALKIALKENREFSHVYATPLA